MKKEIVFFLVMLCCCVLCRAQQVVSSGGYSVKAEMTVDWIIGGSLSDIPANDITTLYLLQKEQLMESRISLKVYPIPTTDFINIEISPVDTGRINLELYSNAGAKIITKVFSNQAKLQMNISNLPKGIYYLKVLLTGEENPFRIEKIIKI